MPRVDTHDDDTFFPSWQTDCQTDEAASLDAAIEPISSSEYLETIQITVELADAIKKSKSPELLVPVLELLKRMQNWSELNQCELLSGKSSGSAELMSPFLKILRFPDVWKMSTA